MARRPRLDLDGFHHIDVYSALVSYVFRRCSGLLAEAKVLGI
ncbi:MAG: hypothetical protein Q9M39_00515 [Sulfurovum sp.]|nr:hypothetical protein [Sulfurovum sp.]